MRACALTLSLALLPLSGCSWLLVEAPPPGHEHLRYFDCSTSRAAPIVDTVLGGLYGLTAVEMAVDRSGSGSGVPAGETVTLVVVEAGLAAMFGVSAVYGYGTTAKCDDAKASLTERTLASPARTPSAPRTPRGCGSDADCAGDRICEQGACVVPPELVLPAAPTVPASAPTEPTVPAPATPTPTPAPAPSPSPSPTPAR